MILRHSAAAVGGLLVWGFVLEPLLNNFLPARIARLLPFVAGHHMISYTSDINPVKSMAVEITRTDNALIFGGYGALALIVGAVLLHRRDIS
jgi:ABC-2 type transport system permease protein